jgi:hypothetical protein
MYLFKCPILGLLFGIIKQLLPSDFSGIFVFFESLDCKMSLMSFSLAFPNLEVEELATAILLVRLKSIRFGLSRHFSRELEIEICQRLLNTHFV